MMNRYIQYIGVSLLIFLFLLSCGHSRFPKLTLQVQPVDSTDTILWEIRVAVDGQRMTHTYSFLEVEPPTIELDTNIYKEVLFIHAGGDSLLYFKLIDGLWKRTTPIPASEQDTLKRAITLSMEDIHGKEQSMRSVWQEHPTLLVFASPIDDKLPADSVLKLREEALKRTLKQNHQGAKGDSISRQEANKKLDSVSRIYYFLNTSDSTVRRLAKEYKLRGVCYSDSTTKVSHLRERYGISQRIAPVIYAVDTLGKIIR